ncbi:MAG: alpha/beta fold hydrolase [Lentisphaeria bacterium]|nr:alpha/beta fold hydrolase [Lentisphaeria bacterium]
MDKSTAQPGAEVWRDLYPFESHWLDLGGVRMHYVDEGEGEAVVMLHGNPTWSFFYREPIKALRSSHRVIVPDHIGCGLSDKPQDYAYTLEQHIGNLERLIDDELGLERVSLVVHDWGGAIGMGYATRHPEKIDRIVAMNTAAFLLDKCPWRIRVCRIPGFGALAVRGFNAFAGAAVHMALAKGQTMPPEVKAGFLHPYDSYQNRIATLRFVEDIPLSPKHPSWETMATIQKQLHELQDRPMMLCWGDQDFCFTPSFLDIWQQYFPHATVHRFPDAGHYLLEDAGDRIVPLIAEFLRDGA